MSRQAHELEELPAGSISLAPLDRSIVKRRMLVIVNPHATTVSDRLKNLIVYALQSRYDVEAVDTREPGHATELARDSVARGCEVVVAFGGDGTANEAANGLIGSGVALTCLPGGMTNVFCRLIGVPADIVDAVEHLLRIADRFEPRQVDLGEANGRAFAFSAGVGLDAAVVKTAEMRPALKSRFGDLYYASTAVVTFARHSLVKAPRLSLEVDGKSASGVAVVAQNGEAFTFLGDRGLELCRDAGLNTGTLAMLALDRANPVDVPALMWRLFSSRSKVVDHRHVAHFEGVTEAKVTVASGDQAPLHVDGDYVGDFETVTFRARPRALTVVS